MKRSLLLILTFLSIFTMAQNKSYDKKWESIDKQQNEGLFKSTLPAINEIYKQAKKEGNTQQLIRALLYQSKVMLATTEDEDLEYKVVENFRKEIAESKSKVDQSILESMLAETLATYYRSNQWKIRQQTRLENKTSDDFRFWSVNIFEDEVSKLYISSIKEAELLQKEDLKKWEGILEVSKDKQNRELRPVLYDLLVHRAIEGSEVFGEESSATKKELLENLVNYHSKKNDINASLYNQQLLLNLDKDKISSDKYISELQKLSSKDKTAWYSGNILLELANFYIEKSNQEEENSFQTKKEWTTKALVAINQIETDYSKTDAEKGAKVLKDNILTQSIEISIQNYISPNQNNPLGIAHKNVDKVYFKVLRYKIDLNNLTDALRAYQNAKQEDKQKELDKIFKQYPLEKEFSLDLKSFDDYQTHATIAKLDPLKEGSYIVLVSNYADFKVGKEDFILAYKQISVTASALLSNMKELFVTDRESGWALPNKTVEFYKQDKNKAKLIKSLQTDSEGKISVPIKNIFDLIRYHIKIKGEEVLYNNYFYNDGYLVDDDKESFETAFFIDRGIYRPGQTLYFKAILFKTQKEQKNVRKNQKTTITLYDANGKAIKEKTLVTNEFGSVSGEFILPNSGITSRYYLSNEDEDKYFTIEEYKRPKFEVKFDAVKDSFELEKEVVAKGKAVAYSGANIDRAKVVYRVYREPIFPYLPWWRMPIIGMGNTEEITQGETITDAEGKFEVKFIAVPEKEKSKDKRTYRYIVNADVIDSNGETHSSEQTITIGDSKWILSFDAAEKVEWEDLKKIKLNTKNLNGEVVSLKPEISLTKIEGDDRILRETQFSSGDYALYSKEEFAQYFPHDAYKYGKPKEGELIASTKINTAKETEIGLNPKEKWEEGYYILKAFVMDGKDSIQTEQKIYLYKKDKKKPIENELFSVIQDKETYQPGEIAKLYFTSSAPKSVVYLELEYNEEIIKKEQLQLNNSVEVFTVPIEEKYRGNVFVHYYFGKYNTAEASDITLVVPFDNKDLKITAGTLRDKLRPGDKEIWELTVSGNKKDKFIAEVLATMYDASLNQFASNEINFKPYSSIHYSLRRSWDTDNSFDNSNFNHLNTDTKPYIDYNRNYFFDQINWFGFSLNPYQFRNQNQMIRGISKPEMALGREKDRIENQWANSAVTEGEEMPMMAAKSKQDYSGGASKQNLSNVAVRRNLEETAFFYPTLRTDEKGNVKIQFTAPESLTEWKFMALAHTEDLKTANFETTIKTQKELMVVPNLPRFLREGDEVVIASKIVNLSNKNLSGSAQLMLFDAFTMQSIDDEFGNKNAKQSFKATKGSSDNLKWTVKVPTAHQAVVYRIVASSGSFSDGEESALPILSNRMLVTETLPIYVSEGQKKTFTFDKLKDNQSKTLENFKLSLEMTNNPIWYAIFSLPYLKEYPYEGAEQVFSRYYANLISQHLIQTSPKIKAVFEDWNKKGQLSSKLENNEELKSILLEETPWVREAESETEQMKRIALLFDLNKMQNETAQTLDKLKSKQSESGGFSWFDGGRQNNYITTHIVSGFGHLKEMGIDYDKEIVKKAIQSIDEEMEEKYNIYLKNNKLAPSTAEGIQYLYARSYFLTDYPLNKKKTEIVNYFLKEFQKTKVTESLQLQAMLALLYNRFDKKEAATKLLTSIKDNSVESEEMGMYWKNNISGWYWYQAPIETQSLLIEAFDKVLKDTKSVEKMKVWLLKNKQTNRWNSTKATTEAVYALMSTGKDWVNTDNKIDLKLGDKVIDLDKLENSPYKGSGYVKTSWNKEEIKPEMAKIEVNKTSSGTAWGAIYWQYFEDLDKITSANTSVKFDKQLFLKKNTEKGPELKSITTKTPIQIGDLVTVRLEIKIDRDMQFVHLKDMRASGFEPINVLSAYKFQGGLGYYESTRDAATHFFIDNLPKGIYVFEYDVRANNSGVFSNGITSLQNMYAPELSAHSEGIKVEIQ